MGKAGIDVVQDTTHLSGISFSKRLTSTTSLALFSKIAVSGRWLLAGPVFYRVEWHVMMFE
jgi:hypothetical protein